MRPNYYDDPVIDELGNIHTLEEYCSGSGDISNTPVSFTSDDNIQNPDNPISMPLFKSGNALKDLMRWISKAFQNIRYLLKKVSDLDSDITINTEKIGDIEDNTAKIWTDTTVALAGEYYLDENILWMCKVDNSHKPSEGLDWTAVKIMDEVSELNDAIDGLIVKQKFTKSYTVQANNNASVEFANIEKSGYTPIAIAEFNTGIGAVVPFEVSISIYENKAFLSLRNVTSTDRSEVATIQVLYIKNI